MDEYNLSFYHYLWKQMKWAGKTFLLCGIILFVLMFLSNFVSADTGSDIEGKIQEYWGLNNDNLTGLRGTVFSESGMTNRSAKFDTGQYGDGTNYLYTDLILGDGSNTTEFAYVMWFNASNVTASWTYLPNKHTGTIAGIFGFFYSAEKNHISLGVEGRNTTSATTIQDVLQLYNNSLTSSSFNMIALWRNSTNVCAFLNGYTNCTINRQVYVNYIKGFSPNSKYSDKTVPLTGVVDDLLFFNQTLTQTEIEYIWNSGTGRTYPFTSTNVTPPDYTPIFINQTPNDITTMNMFGQRLNITYNYSDTNITNTTSIILNYSVTNTVNIINGTSYSTTTTQNPSYNISINYTFLLADNSILPGVYNINETIMENTEHFSATLNNANYVVSLELLGVNISKQYNQFEIMSNTTGTSAIYYCNSSYTTGNPSVNNNCIQFGTLTQTGFNHTHIGGNSSHNVFSLPINSSGYISSVKATSLSYFLLIGTTTGATTYYYINNETRTGAVKRSTNNGATYTNQTYLVDYHLHQFNVNENNFTYNACYTNNSGTRICSTSRNDNLDLSPLPPTSPDINSPMNQKYGYNQTMLINWSLSIPFNSSTTIVNYNISLLNDDETHNSFIALSYLPTSQYYDATQYNNANTSYVIIRNISVNTFVYNYSYDHRASSSSGIERTNATIFYLDGTTTDCGQSLESSAVWTTKNCDVNDNKAVRNIVIYGYISSASYQAQYRNITIRYAPTNWTINVPPESYKMKIEATDSNGLSSIAISDIFNITNLINITGRNAYTLAPITSFSGWIYNIPTGINETYDNTTSDLFKIYSGLNTIYFEADDYSISADNYYNQTISSNGTGQYSKAFSLYTNNSIIINIFDESDSTPILQNISIEMQQSNLTMATYYTTNGTYFLENVPDGLYTFIIGGAIGVNYSDRSYDVTVASRSTQILNAFLINSGLSVTISALDSLTFAVLEGASVSQYRSINNSWTLVQVKATDITGRALFYYLADTKYRFIVQNTGYTTKQFDLDPIIYTSYSVYLQKSVIYNYTGDFEDVKITFSPWQYFANANNNFIWLITSPNGTLESYGVNVTTPCNNYSFSGNNSYGQTFNQIFTIPCANFTDKVIISYYYDTIYTGRKNFKTSFYVSGATTQNNYTFANLRNEHYGLGDLERIILVTFFVLIIAGVTFAVVGGTPALIVGMLIFAYFTYTGFISFWFTALTFVIGVMIWLGGRE